MKTIYSILIALLIINTSNAQVAVIANKSIKKDKISKSELLDCYTGDMQKWDDGQRIYVFDLKTKTDIKEIFYEFLGKSPSRMKSIWMKRLLSGEGDPPQSLKTEREMLKKVSETKGAVGFISYDSVTTDVKILAIIEAEDN